VLNEDDGETLDYQRGGWCTTRFECSASEAEGKRQVELRIGRRIQGAAGFTPAPRSFELRFHGCCGAEIQVSLDGAPIERAAGTNDLTQRDCVWTCDEVTGIIAARVADTGIARSIAVQAVAG
jgi:hypothetical protein